MPHTITAQRPDLEALEVNFPFDYIGNIVYPVRKAAKKGGTITYQELVADQTAQTNRVANAAPSRTLLGTSSTTWTASEKIYGFDIPESEEDQYESVTNMDTVGGKAAKRTVMKNLEAAAAVKLFSTARYNAASDIGSAIIAGLQDAADSVRRYNGRLALVCSKTFLQALLAETEISDILKAQYGNSNIVPAMILQPENLKNVLASIFKFDAVLVGDDTYWKLATKEDGAAVVMLPPSEDGSEKMDPILGGNWTFMMGESGSPVRINSFYDENRHTNTYDATAFNQLVELNADAAVMVKGIGTPTT